jgi:hypothetical protein
MAVIICVQVKFYDLRMLYEPLQHRNPSKHSFIMKPLSAAPSDDSVKKMKRDDCQELSYYSRAWVQDAANATPSWQYLKQRTSQKNLGVDFKINKELKCEFYPPKQRVPTAELSLPPKKNYSLKLYA